MFGPQPIAAARCILFLTVLVLPADARDRYREEFRGEISGLGAVAQLPESLSLLLGSYSLRSALKEREMTVTQPLKQDWRCHLGRHHFIVKPDDNPEVRGQTVLECTRCGRHEDGKHVGPPLGPNAAGLAFPGVG